MQPSDSKMSDNKIKELIKQKEAEMSVFRKKWSDEHNKLLVEIVKLNELLSEDEIFYYFDPKNLITVQYSLNSRSEDVHKVYTPALESQRDYYPTIEFTIKRSPSEILTNLAEHHIFKDREKAINHQIKRIKDAL